MTTMKVTRAGALDTGVTVPVGTEVEYCGHVPGGMVRVTLPDGASGIMHPGCFAELSEKPKPKEPRRKRAGPFPLPLEVPAFQAWPVDHVGDGKKPNVYVVTDRGVVVTLTRDGPTGYRHWRTLADRRPLVESALEDRVTGVLASVEPDSDEPGARLEVRDDWHMHRATFGD